MQFTVLINQYRAMEWGLNAQQAMLFAFLYNAPTWATAVEIGGVAYCHVSKSKVVDDMPLLTDKPDTVYRLMRQLCDLGVIKIDCRENKTLVCITEKGALWNSHQGVGKKSEVVDNPPDKGRKKIRPQAEGSEKYPNKVGKISEPGSEKNPTYQSISNQVIKSNIIDGNAHACEAEPVDEKTPVDQFDPVDDDPTPLIDPFPKNGNQAFATAELQDQQEILTDGVLDWYPPEHIIEQLEQLNIPREFICRSDQLVEFRTYWGCRPDVPLRLLPNKFTAMVIRQWRQHETATATGATTTATQQHSNGATTDEKRSGRSATGRDAVGRALEDIHNVDWARGA